LATVTNEINAAIISSGPLTNHRKRKKYLWPMIVRDDPTTVLLSIVLIFNHQKTPSTVLG